MNDTAILSTGATYLHCIIIRKKDLYKIDGVYTFYDNTVESGLIVAKLLVDKKLLPLEYDKDHYELFHLEICLSFGLTVTGRNADKIKVIKKGLSK